MSESASNQPSVSTSGRITHSRRQSSSLFAATSGQDTSRSTTVPQRRVSFRTRQKPSHLSDFDSVTISDIHSTADMIAYQEPLESYQRAARSRNPVPLLLSLPTGEGGNRAIVRVYRPTLDADIPWTEEKDNILREMSSVPGWTIDEIMTRVGRGYGATKARLSVLSNPRRGRAAHTLADAAVTPPQVWTAEAIRKYTTVLQQPGWDFRSAAQYIGVRESAVYHRWMKDFRRYRVTAPEALAAERGEQVSVRRVRADWSPAETAQLMALTSVAGWTYADVTAALGRDYISVNHKLKGLSDSGTFTPQPYRKQTKAWPSSDVEKLYRLTSVPGWTFASVAREMGRSYNEINNKMKYLKLQGYYPEVSPSRGEQGSTKIGPGGSRVYSGSTNVPLTSTASIETLNFTPAQQISTSSLGVGSGIPLPIRRPREDHLVEPSRPDHVPVFENWLSRSPLPPIYPYNVHPIPDAMSMSFHPLSTSRVPPR